MKRLGGQAAVAASLATHFLAFYAIAGALIMVVIHACGGADGMTSIGIMVHFVSAVILYPSAALTILLLQIWRGSASGRRLTVAGLVAAPIVWVGVIVASNLCDRLHAELVPVVGNWAGPLLVVGWAILMSNATLLIAWIVPRGERSRS